MTCKSKLSVGLTCQAFVLFAAAVVLRVSAVTGCVGSVTPVSHRRDTPRQDCCK